MGGKIAPGSRIEIEVVKQPTNVAAAKTIVRLLCKDSNMAAENERLRRIRATHAKPTARSGRQWIVRLIKQRPAKANVGQKGTITATIDVVNDLNSVSRFLKVSKA